MNLSETHLKYPKRLTNLIAQQAANHFTCASYKQEIITHKKPNLISKLIAECIHGWKTLVIILVTYIIAINF